MRPGVSRPVFVWARATGAATASSRVRQASARHVVHAAACRIG